MDFFNLMNYILFSSLFVTSILLMYFIIKLNFKENNINTSGKIKYYGKISLIIWLLITLNILLNIAKIY